MQTIPDALQQRHQQWIDIVNQGDIDQYANLLTDNAVWIPPGQKPIIGRDAFKQWLTPFIHQFSYDFSITEERFRVAGNWAVERAKFSAKMTPRQGGEKSMAHMGTFTALWFRDTDAQWYIERYIDDTDL